MRLSGRQRPGGNDIRFARVPCFEPLESRLFLSADPILAGLSAPLDVSVSERAVVSETSLIPAVHRKAIVESVAAQVVAGVSSYAGGSGTVNDPFQIATVESFRLLGETPADWGKCFVLTADLDFQGGDLTPIGSYYGTSFTGVFDGNAHVVRNGVVLERLDDPYLGLFVSLGPGGQIKNLGAEDMTVISHRPYDESPCVGGLVGVNWGAVSNCHFTGNVGSEGAAGGLVGFNGISITDCYTTAEVYGRLGAGGLVAINNGSTADCYTAGTVVGWNYIGGLAGWNDGSITGCHTAGIVHGAQRVGGLVGQSDGTICGCYSEASVSGGEYVGGLAGEINVISGSDEVNALVNCYATGSVSGTDDPRADNPGFYIGGLAGSCHTIVHCYATGSVSTVGLTGWYVGGLVGKCDTILTSYATGDVSGLYLVGGLAGSCGRIDQSYATGAVAGGQYGAWIGGLAGEGRMISDSYATGAVAGQYAVAGLLGLCNGEVRRCYAAGHVAAMPGEQYIGGLIGQSEDGSVVVASLWDVQTSGQTSSAGGVGKTTAQMKQKTTFTNAGWDFANIWRMPANDYPQLIQQFAADRTPNTPVGKSPAKNAVKVPLSPILTASEFSDPDRGDAHAASQWQVDVSSDFQNPIWNVLDTDADKTAEAVPSGLLTDYTTYHWRVRYMDSRGAWSEWSAPIAFTTVSTDLLWSSVYGTPTSVGAGGTLDISRKYRISGLAPSSDFTISYRLSVNQTWGDADDVLLTQESVTTEAGKTIGFHSGTLSVVVPDSIARRSYYLLAKVDDGDAVREANEGNNVRVANIVKVTDPPAPDLSWYSLSSLPTNVAVGGMLTVQRSYRVTTLAVGSDFSIAYHLSANTTWGDADDVFLTRETITAEADKTVGLHSSTLTVAAPASTAPGYYYLLAKVDDADAVHESNENNNIKGGTFMRVM